MNKAIASRSTTRVRGTRFSVRVRERGTGVRSRKHIPIHPRRLASLRARCTRNARNLPRRTSDPEAFISHDLLLNTAACPVHAPPVPTHVWTFMVTFHWVLSRFTSRWKKGHSRVSICVAEKILLFSFSQLNRWGRDYHFLWKLLMDFFFGLLWKTWRWLSQSWESLIWSFWRD